ncbi:MAG: NPXTG-anchored protein [Oscillospiraceae bacterium]|nr:NPXTG-anchored protein [Oscillospiraceae bacterium]
MKLKKILAAVAAAAVAVSTMAVSAFAIKDYPDGYTLDLIAEGYDVTAVAGFTFKISGDIDSGVGGGVGFNSKTTGWDSTEWGNDDAGKAIKASNGEVTIKRDAPVFKESDVNDPTNPYAQIWMQQWWGTDITIDSVIVLDKDGNALTPASAAPAEEAPAPVADVKSNVAELNKDAGYIDGKTPSVTITNADFGVTDIKSVAIDIAIAPDAGDFNWNDWCGSAVKVTDADGVKYYAFGGAQVTWNNDVDDDGTDDIIGGVNGDQWLGTVKSDRTVTLNVPVNGDFTIDIITMWWDSYTGTTYTVKTATADGTAVAAAPAAEETATAAAPEEDAAEDEDVDVDEVDVDEDTDETESEPVADIEAPTVDEAPAPVVENATAAPATGNTAVATVVAVMAVAGAAAIVSKKRK